MIKILSITFIILCVAVGGLAAFVLTFDIDKHRPFIVQKIEEGAGNPVSLGKISLGWRGGIALTVEDIAVFGEGSSPEKAPLRLDEVSALVRLLPLLRQDIQVGSIFLDRPDIQILQTVDGTIRIPGLKTPAPQDGGNKGSAALPFVIESIGISEGRVLFQSNYQNSYYQIPVQNLDVEVTDVSLSRPLKFDAKAALFSNAQNIHIKGRFKPDLMTQVHSIEDLRAETDLSQLIVADLMQAIPELAKAGIEGGLKGKIAFRLDFLGLGSNPLTDLNASLQLDDGYLMLKGIGSPLSDMRVRATVKDDQVHIHDASLNFAGSRITAEGNIRSLSSRPMSGFQTEVRDLNLAEVVPPPAPGQASIRGKLSAYFKGNAALQETGIVLNSVKGQGNIALRDGVLLNVNILREVLNKLSMLPGLVDRLKARLPESYNEKLSAEHTYLAPFDWQVKVDNGIIRAPNLSLGTDSFELTGVGEISLLGPISFQTMLRLDPALSEAFIRSVAELRYLADQEGRLQIPVQIQGTTQRPVAFPDLRYVASRLAAAKTQEWIGSLIEKKSPQGDAEQPQAGQQTGTQSTTSAGSVPAPRQSDLLGGFLQNTLGGGTPSGGQTPQAGSQTQPRPADLLGGLLQAALGGQSGSTQSGNSSGSGTG